MAKAKGLGAKIAENLPVVGTAMDVAEVGKSLATGQYGKAAVDAGIALAGVTPIGRIATRLGRKAIDVFRKTDDKIIATKMIEDQATRKNWTKTKQRELGIDPKDKTYGDNDLVPKAELKRRQTRKFAEEAEKLEKGEITGKEFRDFTKENQPATKFDEADLETMVPTFEDLVGGLDALGQNKAKTGVIGLNASIEKGAEVKTRLDIPAYNRRDIWVATLSKLTGDTKAKYGRTAVLKDVEFFIEGKSPNKIMTTLDIAKGKKDKTPFATMKGKWQDVSDEDAYKQAQDAIKNPEEWTQVGFNPERNSFFYDKDTMLPVFNATEVIQVGPLVLAKNAKVDLPKELKRALTYTNISKYMKKGESVGEALNRIRKDDAAVDRALQFLDDTTNRKVSVGERVRKIRDLELPRVDPKKEKQFIREGMSAGEAREAARLRPESTPPVVFNKGGDTMDQQMQFAFMNTGGMLGDDGMTKDPVSGNPIPSGSMAKEVRDDIPAMLSEGEYVVPADVVRYHGVEKFEDLRNEAKQGFSGMEADGRIGGQPVKEQESFPFAVEELMGYQEGGDTYDFGDFTPGQRYPSRRMGTGYELRTFSNPATGKSIVIPFFNGMPMQYIPPEFREGATTTTETSYSAAAEEQSRQEDEAEAARLSGPYGQYGQPIAGALPSSFPAQADSIATKSFDEYSAKDWRDYIAFRESTTGKFVSKLPILGNILSMQESAAKSFARRALIQGKNPSTGEPLTNAEASALMQVTDLERGKTLIEKVGEFLTGKKSYDMTPPIDTELRRTTYEPQKPIDEKPAPGTDFLGTDTLGELGATDTQPKQTFTDYAPIGERKVTDAKQFLADREAAKTTAEKAAQIIKEPEYLWVTFPGQNLNRRFRVNKKDAHLLGQTAENATRALTNIDKNLNLRDGKYSIPKVFSKGKDTAKILSASEIQRRTGAVDDRNPEDVSVEINQAIDDNRVDADKKSVLRTIVDSIISPAAASTVPVGTSVGVGNITADTIEKTPDLLSDLLNREAGVSSLADLSNSGSIKRQGGVVERDGQTLFKPYQLEYTKIENGKEVQVKETFDDGTAKFTLGPGIVLEKGTDPNKLYTQEFVEQKFNQAFTAAQDSVERNYNTDRMPPDIKKTLTQMTYQLGEDGIRKFRQMNKAIAEGDYEEAAKQITTNYITADGDFVRSDNPNVVRTTSTDYQNQMAKSGRAQDMAGYMANSVGPLKGATDVAQVPPKSPFDKAALATDVPTVQGEPLLEQYIPPTRTDIRLAGGVDAFAGAPTAIPVGQTAQEQLGFGPPPARGVLPKVDTTSAARPPATDPFAPIPGPSSGGMSRFMASPEFNQFGQTTGPMLQDAVLPDMSAFTPSPSRRTRRVTPGTTGINQFIEDMGTVGAGTAQRADALQERRSIGRVNQGIRQTGQIQPPGVEAQTTEAFGVVGSADPFIGTFPGEQPVGPSMALPGLRDSRQPIFDASADKAQREADYSQFVRQQEQQREAARMAEQERLRRQAEARALEQERFRREAERLAAEEERKRKEAEAAAKARAEREAQERMIYQETLARTPPTTQADRETEEIYQQNLARVREEQRQANIARLRDPVEQARDRILQDPRRDIAISSESGAEREQRERREADEMRRAEQMRQRQEQSRREEDSGGNIGGGDPSPGGDDGKIVCTEMYRQTQLVDWQKAMKIWDVYQRRYLTPEHQIGYHWLFKPYVKGMQSNKLLTRLGAVLAKKRTQHLKHILTKGRAKDDLVGRLWCSIIHPIVHKAGKIKNFLDGKTKAT